MQKTCLSFFSDEITVNNCFQDSKINEVVNNDEVGGLVFLEISHIEFIVEDQD